MTRRPLLLLAAILLAVLIIAAFVLWCWVGLLRELGGNGEPIVQNENRPLTAGADSGAGVYAFSLPSATPASRGFARPVLPVSPDPAADRPVARTTSPSASASAALARRSVTTQGPAVDVSTASAAGLSANPHGTLKQRIEWCESRGLNVVNRASDASGFWQFLDGTFEAVTGLPGKASDYPLSVQSKAFDALYAIAGTSPWNSSRWCWETR